ncbi:MAG: aldehyde dehydrogenase family protein, partial [Comamonadaceae bacterium]
MCKRRVEELVTSIILPQPALHIGGRKIVAGVGGEYRHVNPTTGAPQASVPLAGPQDVDSAVQAAVDAFSVWSAMPPSDRRDILISIGTAIADHAEELSMLMALETGLPV